jgi:hypothetical protein
MLGTDIRSDNLKVQLLSHSIISPVHLACSQTWMICSCFSCWNQMSQVGEQHCKCQVIFTHLILISFVQHQDPPYIGEEKKLRKNEESNEHHYPQLLELRSWVSSCLMKQHLLSGSTLYRMTSCQVVGINPMRHSSVMLRADMTIESKLALQKQQQAGQTTSMNSTVSGGSWVKPDDGASEHRPSRPPAAAGIWKTSPWFPPSLACIRGKSLLQYI